jgi:alkaline phosphatase D
MKKLTSLAILSLLAACQSPAELPLIGDVFAPKSADEALEPYYRTLPDDFFPRAPAGLPLDASKPLTRILVASCLDEEKPDSAAMRSLAGETR